MELRVKPLGILTIIGLISILVAIAWAVSNNLGKDEMETKLDIRKQAGGEILFISSETKKDWLDKQVERFNAEQSGKTVVKIEYLETRDAFQDIISGKRKPALWAPSSTAWVGRLGDYWQKQHAGVELLDTSDPSNYRLYLKTPMVFLTTRDKAKFLQPLLSANGKTWDNLHTLSLGQQKAPWGNVKYSYSDPINSGSGFMTLSMIITAYGQSHPEAGKSAEDIVKAPGFKQYLKELNTGYIYSEAAFKGSSDIYKAFKANPGREYDFICTYESNALKAALENPQICVIYPNPTATVDMSIVLLSGADYLTPEQKAGGKLFMQFLAGKKAMQAGVETKFRPATITPGVSLDAELGNVATQGFQTGITAAELPPYDAVNEAAVVWRDVTTTPPAVKALMKAKMEAEKAPVK